MLQNLSISKTLRIYSSKSKKIPPFPFLLEGRRRKKMNSGAKHSENNLDKNSERQNIACSISEAT